MEILLTMIFGLILRFVLSTPTQAQSRLYPALLGVWEGAVLRYLTNQQLTSSSVDPFLSYAVRLCIDFFITDSFAQILTIALWTFLGALALEGVEMGNPEMAKRSVSMQDSTGTSFTKIRNVAVSPSFTPSTSSSPDVMSASTFSPSVRGLASTPVNAPPVHSTLLPMEPVQTPLALVPNLSSEPSEARSPGTYRSYTIPSPLPASSPLSRQPSPETEHEAPIHLILPRSIADLSSYHVQPTLPMLVMEREEPIQDELQTPLRENDMPIADDDDYGDELQTPMALPVTNVGFDGLIEPPVLHLGPSMLLESSDVALPVRIGDVSPAPVPVPLPVPAPLQFSLLDSPLSSIRALSDTSSSWSASPPESVLSAASPTHMYARADELRKQAWKEDRAKTQLELDLAKARTQGRTKDVFILLGEIKAAQMRIDRLHMRAKRRYFRARNSSDSNTLQIDVHGLLVAEAVEETEEAFREVLRSGHRFLRVIVGRGNHSRDHIPKLKPAILQNMQQHGFKCTVDFNNPGVVILEAS